MESLYFFTNMLRNIFVSFFQNGIWVVGFFYLLNKTFESERLIGFSKIVIIAVLAILFIYSILISR